MSLLELPIKIGDATLDKALDQLRAALKNPKGPVTGDAYIEFTGGTTATVEVEQAGIKNGDVVQAFVMRDQTSTKTYANHVGDDVRYVCGNISRAGFTVYGTASGATTGKYRIRWVWYRGN